MNKDKLSPQLNILNEYEFHKTRVLAGISPLGEMIAIKPICENLGIDRKWQQDKIKSDPQFNSTGGMVKVIASDGKNRAMFCLQPSAFQEWLWSLSPTENMNLEILEQYKKGLVVYLLMMLKISLDEVNRLRSQVAELQLLEADIKDYFITNDEGLELNKKSKEKFKSSKKIKDRIINRLGVDPNQLSIGI